MKQREEPPETEKEGACCGIVRTAVAAAVLLCAGVCAPVSAAEEEYPEEEFRKLEAKWMVEAERKYPICRIGEELTITCRNRKGETAKVTDKFYGQDAKSIRIGAETIPKAAIPKEELLRFDPVRSEQLRKEYVNRRVTQFLQAKEAAERKLKNRPEDAGKSVVLSGDRMVTKTKMVYRNWTIEQVDGLFAIVNHETGGGRIPIGELPDDIALKSIAPVIEKEIAPSRGKEPKERLEILREIVKRFPYAEPLVEKERTRILMEQILKRELIQAMEAEDEETRIRNLEKLREKYLPEPWAVEWIERETAEQKDFFQLKKGWLPPFVGDRARWQKIYQPYREVEQALAEAQELAGESRFDQAVAEVEEILRKYPTIAEAYSVPERLESLKKEREENRFWPRLIKRVKNF